MSNWGSEILRTHWQYTEVPTPEPLPKGIPLHQCSGEAFFQKCKILQHFLFSLPIQSRLPLHSNSSMTRPDNLPYGVYFVVFHRIEIDDPLTHKAMAFFKMASNKQAICSEYDQWHASSILGFHSIEQAMSDDWISVLLVFHRFELPSFCTFAICPRPVRTPVECGRHRNITNVANSETPSESGIDWTVSKRDLPALPWTQMSVSINCSPPHISPNERRDFKWPLKIFFWRRKGLYSLKLMRFHKGVTKYRVQGTKYGLFRFWIRNAKIGDLEGENESVYLSFCHFSKFEGC